jgi:protease IV
VAASGGYYIAAGSEQIIANPGTLTGSIGVIMELVNVEGLLQKIGVEGVTIKSGKNKDVGSPFRKMKEEERALMQHVLDDVHTQFIEAVAEGRSLDIEKVRTLADGRIFTGRQAKELGLVDELGSLEVAVMRTAELAGIEGEPQVVETENKLTVFELLRGQFFGKWEGPRFPATSVRLNYLFSF